MNKTRISAPSISALVPAFAAAAIIGTGLTGCASMGGGSKETRLWSKNEDSLAGKKEVYLGHVAVSFMTEDKGSATSESPMFSSNNLSYAKATVVAKLSGVPESVMQEIADDARADLVAELEAKGFTVLNYSDLKKHKEWEEDTVASPYKPSGVGAFIRREDSSTLTFAPTGMDLYAPGARSLWHLSKVADDLDIPVISAKYTIHFAYFGSETDYTVDYATPTLDGEPIKTLSASVEMGQGISVTPYSGIAFAIDGGGTFSDSGSVELRDSVVIAGTYGSNEKTTSGSQKAANAFSSALGFFSGSSSKTEEFTIKANPEYYKAGAEMAIHTTNDKIFAALELE